MKLNEKGERALQPKKIFRHKLYVIFLNGNEGILENASLILLHSSKFHCQNTGSDEQNISRVSSSYRSLQNTVKL